MKTLKTVSSLAALIVLFAVHCAYASDITDRSPYMGGGQSGGTGMNIIRVADLDGDGTHEIVTISRSYLIILDTQGNILSTKPLPVIPISSAAYSQGMSGSGMATSLDVADLDGDNVPEIVTVYYGRYLVVLDNTGALKNYSLIR